MADLVLDKDVLVLISTVASERIDEPGKNSNCFSFFRRKLFFFQAETYQIKWLLNEPYSDKIENDPHR